MISIPNPENFLEATSAFTMLAGFVAILISFWARDRDAALKVAGICFIVALTILSKNSAVYFASIFLVGTSITKLDFLEKLVAILRGNKDYFEYRKALPQNIGSNLPEAPILIKESDAASQSSAREKALDSLDHTGRTLGTEPVIETLTKEEAERIDELAEKASTLADCWQNAEALEILNSVLETDPNNKKALFTKARLSRRLFKFEEAESLDQRLAKLYPEDELTYIALSIGYTYKGNLDESIFLASKALEKNPNSYMAYACLAYSYRQQNRLDKARESIEHASSIAPDAPWVIMESALIFLKEKKYQEAINRASDVLAIAPRSAFALSARADAYRLSKNYALATIDAQRALEISIDHPYAKQVLASISAELEDYKATISHATDGLKTSPNNAYLFWLRAESERKLHQFDASIADATECLKNSPLYTPALNTRAASYAALGRFEEAEQDFAIVLRIDSGNAFAKWYLEMVKKRQIPND